MNESSIVVYEPIGVIRSEHTEARKTPIQPVFARDCKGRAELKPEYLRGLLDLNEFSHIYLIYHFDQVESAKLCVKPFMEDRVHGIFATRAPNRPNAIGLSIVQLESIEGNVLHFRGADILDGTPLLDIKPYTARFDCVVNTRNGWQDQVQEEAAQQLGRREYGL